jgi:hypothetical protein
MCWDEEELAQLFRGMLLPLVAYLRAGAGWFHVIGFSIHPITSILSIPKQVRGCVLRTEYTLVPPAGRKGTFFSSNSVSTLRDSYGKSKGWCLIRVLQLLCGILPVNSRTKWLL